MNNAPVLDRIREARHSISTQFDHDPKKLVAYYLQHQKNHQQKLFGYTKDVESVSLVKQVKPTKTD